MATQTIRVRFFDPVEAHVVNERFQGVRELGIYSDGYMSIVNDTQVNVSQLVCEISDGSYQIKMLTDGPQLVNVTTLTPYVVMRWLYNGTVSNDVQFLALALGGLQANDIIVGMCVYVGAALTGFDYSLRTTPDTHDLFLEVEPTDPASMSVRIRPGRVNYGTQNFFVPDTTLLFAAPVANPRIDVVYIDTDGVPKIKLGDELVAPVAKSFQGKIALAQIALSVGQVSITKANITDTRSFLTGGIVPGQVAGDVLYFNGATNAWDRLPIGTAGQRLRVNTGATGLEYVDVYRLLVWYVDGNLVIGNSKSVTLRMPFNGAFVRADAYVVSPPLGTPIKVQINKNGGNIWFPAPDHRLTILAGVTNGNTLSFDTITFVAGDVFTMDLNQVGSTTAGMSLTVLLTVKETP